MSQSRKVYSGYSDGLLKQRHRALKARGKMDDPEIEDAEIIDAVIEGEYRAELKAEIRTSRQGLDEDFE